MIDGYERRARLAPALLVAFTIALPTVAITGSSTPLLSAAVLINIGLVIPLAELARDRGRAIEPELWAAWGGPLLVQRLAKDESASAIAARRALAEMSLEQKIFVGASTSPLTPESLRELSDIARHRARQLAGNEVVAAENRAYGYQRNLLGLRSLGIWLSIAGCCIALVASLAHATPGTTSWYALAGSIAALVFWIAYPSERRVRSAADRYADSVVGLLAADIRRQTP